MESGVMPTCCLDVGGGISFSVCFVIDLLST